MPPPAEAFRFFRLLPPAHPVAVGGLGLAWIAWVLLCASGAERGPGALAPLFLVQGLAASSGFRGPARRGHYDLLLTGGHGRLLIGVAHWTASTAPGVVCWLAMAVVEATMTSGQRIAISPGTAAGMLLVSTLPWAVTVPFPRLSGAIAWLVVLAMIATAFPVQAQALMAAGDARLPGVPFQTAAILLCPWVVAGREVTAGLLVPVLVTTMVSVVAMGVALLWICHADVPLEAAQ